MMKFSELNFNSFRDGVQAIIDYGNYHLSIVKHSSSYGNALGLYEIGVFSANSGVATGMTSLPGVTYADDTIKGFLTEEEVSAIMKKMVSITGEDGEQV